ncbi:hypothetical protein [Bacillus sp. HNG]|nr:hypothetical protein [Bacillus sp. HNG]
MLKSNEEYNEKIKQMYEEMNTMRKEYEEKVEQLKQEKLDESKSKS